MSVARDEALPAAFVPAVPAPSAALPPLRSPASAFSSMNNAGMVQSKMAEHITLAQAIDESLDNSFGAGATAITMRHASLSLKPPVGGWQSLRADESERSKPRHLMTMVDNGGGMSGERLRQSLQYFSRLDQPPRALRPRTTVSVTASSRDCCSRRSLETAVPPSSRALPQP